MGFSKSLIHSPWDGCNLTTIEKIILTNSTTFTSTKQLDSLTWFFHCLDIVVGSHTRISPLKYLYFFKVTQNIWTNSNDASLYTVSIAVMCRAIVNTLIVYVKMHPNKWAATSGSGRFKTVLQFVASTSFHRHPEKWVRTTMWLQRPWRTDWPSQPIPLFLFYCTT